MKQIPYQHLILELSSFFENLSHDIKNQLGVLGSVPREISAGFSLDEESLKDAIKAYENSNQLTYLLETTSHVLNYLGKQGTGNHNINKSLSEQYCDLTGILLKVFASFILETSFGNLQHKNLQADEPGYWLSVKDHDNISEKFFVAKNVSEFYTEKLASSFLLLDQNSMKTKTALKGNQIKLLKTIISLLPEANYTVELYLVPEISPDSDLRKKNKISLGKISY
ncbi:MAG TPA: hypothetical protein PKA63_13775 [Oligoflexia bacterium]|nr:hypothetical protein [Oligoflexia bacterium]HMP49732.1 hypothetical protein [Oligoflexia bacterium]